MTLRVLATGPLCTVQDLGRSGWFADGVGVSGAADRRSLALANRLVGNDESAAGIECLLGGLELSALAPVTVAVTGAPASITVEGTPNGHASVIDLACGQTVRLGLASAGLRTYVAVRGGIDVPAVLGSRSYDTLSAIGPAPLQVGQELPVGPTPGGWPIIDQAPVAAMTSDPVIARVSFGPRDEWFEQPQDLLDGWWEVSDRSDRVGARLIRPERFPSLRRRDESELPSEGIPLGAVQVPPSGEPVIFLADHPITGGYPVIGVVVDADIDLVAQARPGQQIRFVRA
ncbi:biotin-dependent carboxyltransferase family protein [Antrihabitans cavernicola]|uniref:Biotin-dependent carboxyltransferase family protein n=1 Tax=Antrihabitans cavernicola TaxID=2495913 RepID=A0A5A7S8G7_9NOCA|nr:biotin-dependent carboxyltransferase family protein [Spelaeibacter cavernicola]KAA0021217.1 biotin-dependent carboxyltransferase family protein [Spelaeibacter cavernicola]